jgi:DNA-binding CsgD family transcriptional regulator
MPSVVARREIPQADFLEKRFHLTHAEARLVVHLVQGTSLKSSAEALGIKYETVRSYLKSAFLKTGTHRQAELVLRVFQAMSDPNPPAVPAAMSAQELRTAVQNGRGTPRTIEAPPFGGLCRTKAAPPTERSRTEPTREAAMAAPRSGP